MKHAFFPGTFDPPTLGHLDIISRASKLFSKLTVGVGENNRKPHPLLSIDERRELLSKLTKPFGNVEVISFSGLVADYALRHNVDMIVRGLRGADDIAYEASMAFANREMCSIETLFLVSDGKHAHLSSSLIREIAHSGHSLELFLPPDVVQAVYKKAKKGSSD